MSNPYRPYDFAKSVARKSRAFRQAFDQYLAESNLVTDSAIETWLQSTHTPLVRNTRDETFSPAQLYSKWQELIDAKGYPL